MILLLFYLLTALLIIFFLLAIAILQLFFLTHKQVSFFVYFMFGIKYTNIQFLLFLKIYNHQKMQQRL